MWYIHYANEEWETDLDNVTRPNVMLLLPRMVQKYHYLFDVRRLSGDIVVYVYDHRIGPVSEKKP